MRALCVCHYGHSRSVALVRVLHGKGIEAVAAGAFTAGSQFLRAACEQATHIFVMEPHFLEQIPHEERDKVVCLNVGPDKWSNPYNQELLALCEKLLEETLYTSKRPNQ